MMLPNPSPAVRVHSPAAVGSPIRPTLLAVAAHLVMVGGALLTVPAAHALADAPLVAHVPPEDETRSYDIPSGALGPALMRFASESGALLAALPTLVEGKRSPGVRGSFSVQAGLNALLAGTGLTAVRDAQGQYVLREAADVAMLPVVRVSADASPSKPLPAYAGGQVGTGGRLGMLGDADFMDAPFSINSYTAELIASQQARSLANIVDNDPAVQVSTRGRGTNTGGDTFRIRGFNLHAGDISLNGLYIAPNATVSMETVERVEIIKGPNALLSGVSPGGNVGGSINVVPKRAADVPLTRVTGIYRSDAQFGTHMDVGRRFGQDNRFGVRFNGVYLQGDTAVRGQNSTLGVARLGVDYRGGRLRLSGDIGYQKERADGASGFGSGLQIMDGVSVPDAPSASKRTAQSWERTENKDTYAALHVEYDLTQDITLYGGAGARNNTPYNLRTNHSLLDDDGTLRSSPVYYPEYSDRRTVMSGLRGRFTTGVISHQINLQASILNVEGGWLYEAGDPFLSDLNQVGRIALPSDFELSGRIPKGYERKLSSIAVADTLGFLGDRVLLTLGARHQRVEVNNFAPDSGTRTSHDDEAITTPSVGIAVRPWDHITF